MLIAGACLVGVAVFIGSGLTNAGLTSASNSITAPVAVETLPIADTTPLASSDSEYHSASGEGQFTASGQLVGGR
jgi:hypothetical protein